MYQSLVAEEAVRQPEGQGRFNPYATYPQWRIPIRFGVLSYEKFLFNRKDDPAQNRNLWEQDLPQRGKLLDRLVATLEAEAAPPEQFEWLGFST